MQNLEGSTARNLAFDFALKDDIKLGIPLALSEIVEARHDTGSSCLGFVIRGNQDIVHESGTKVDANSISQVSLQSLCRAL